MFDGEVLQVAPPQEIYADPANRQVAEFVGSPKINMLEGLVGDKGRIAAAGTTFRLAAAPTLAPETAVAIGIRPEAFYLAKHAGRGIVTGSVRLVEHMGSDLFIHLDGPGAREPIVARLPAERAPEIQLGQTVHLGVDPARMVAFDAEGRRIRHERATVAELRRSA